MGGWLLCNIHQGLVIGPSSCQVIGEKWQDNKNLFRDLLSGSTCYRAILKPPSRWKMAQE